MSDPGGPDQDRGLEIEIANVGDPGHVSEKAAGDIGPDQEIVTAEEAATTTVAARVIAKIATGRIKIMANVTIGTERSSEKGEVEARIQCLLKKQTK